jgi:hypothetical protein
MLCFAHLPPSKNTPRSPPHLILLSVLKRIQCCRGAKGASSKRISVRCGGAE